MVRAANSQVRPNRKRIVPRLARRRRVALGLRLSLCRATELRVCLIRITITATYRTKLNSSTVNIGPMKEAQNTMEWLRKQLRRQGGGGQGGETGRGRDRERGETGREGREEMTDTKQLQVWGLQFASPYDEVIRGGIPFQQVDGQGDQHRNHRQSCTDWTHHSNTTPMVRAKLQH